MVVDVESPPFESRIAILRNKTRDHRDKIGDDVIEFIAESVRGNIRDLEGVLTNLITQVEFKKTILTLQDVKTYLKNNVKNKTISRRLKVKKSGK